MKRFVTSQASLRYEDRLKENNGKSRAGNSHIHSSENAFQEVGKDNQPNMCTFLHLVYILYKVYYKAVSRGRVGLRSLNTSLRNFV